jgi:hypothetical protein
VTYCPSQAQHESIRSLLSTLGLSRIDFPEIEYYRRCSRLCLLDAEIEMQGSDSIGRLRLEFKFTAPRGQINPIYHCGLISAMPRGWRFLGGGLVVWLLLWPLQERGPVRRCEINSLPRGSAPHPRDHGSS